MNATQIKHMVDRFLSWRLPENFNPDGGISFARTFNEHTAHPMKHEPTGTNLFDATQADAMVRHMIEGLPRPADSGPTTEKTMTVRAKFYVTSILHHHVTRAGAVCAEVKLAPVYGDANKPWSEATPQGQVTMLITNPAAIEAFDLGKEYFVDFSPALEPA